MFPSVDCSLTLQTTLAEIEKHQLKITNIRCPAAANWAKIIVLDRENEIFFS